MFSYNPYVRQFHERERPNVETRARVVVEKNGKKSLAFDYLKDGEVKYSDLQNPVPPAGIRPKRWEFLRCWAFAQFVGIESKGTYKGKKWDNRVGINYKDALSKEDIAEIITGQYYYDSLAKTQVPKLGSLGTV